MAAVTFVQKPCTSFQKCEKYLKYCLDTQHCVTAAASDDRHKHCKYRCGGQSDICTPLK